MSDIEVNIKKASVYGITFSPLENHNFIRNLSKNQIYFFVNNLNFTSYTLNENDTNFEYEINIDENSILDYHDFILLYIITPNSSSDFYAIYLHQIFYLGECLNLLPKLPVDRRKNVKVTTELIKANNTDVVSQGGVSLYINGIGSNSTFNLPSTKGVNDDIPINICLRDLDNNLAPDSNYIINVQIVKK